MKTKLILACFLVMTLFSRAQWVNLFPNIYTVKDYVGINTPGTAPFNPLYPLHVVQNDPSGAGAQIAGYFDYSANTTGNHVALSAVARDVRFQSTYIIGVNGEGYDGPNSFGGAFSAGNQIGNGVVTIGVYGKLDPSTGPYSAGISTGVYGDDWSTGGSGGAGPNWGGFFVGDVYSTTNFFPSDRQLKSDIKPLTSALDKIMLLKPSTYNYKYEDFKGLSLPRTPQMGLIAQELEEVFPDLVKETGMPGRGDDGTVIATGKTFKTINYVSLIPVLISAIQEQQKQIIEQRQLINDLQKTSSSTGLNEINTADGFAMLQNEPNPFNGETVVKYTLPAEVRTAGMLIYDLSGKQVASFPITEKGSSSITITSERLAAGIYIYSIVADNKIVDTKRMVVAEK